MLEFLYPIITIIGLTSLGVIFYFSLHLKRILKTLTLLLKIQTNSSENIKEYIDSISLQLKEIGVNDILYKLSYSYTTIIHEDNNVKILVKNEIDESMVSGYIALHVNIDKGEQKILNKLILHIVTMQIINKIYSKINTANESFKKVAKLQTYMVHDLKNILQFFGAMQYNLKNIQSDEEKCRFIDYLKNSTEPINRKVNSILSLLKSHSNLAKESGSKIISVASVFKEYALFYGLECTIDGDAELFAEQDHIQTIVENLLGNVYDKASSDKSVRCKVEIKTDNEKIYIELSDSGEGFKNPLEVCEPFYTTKDEGIGIGMYQVATIVEFLGGSIVCQNVNNRPQVNITLPYKN